jgi:hypothetical protein
MGKDMIVIPFEYGRCFVETIRGDLYLVDLLEYEGNGWCNCRDFECRHQPLLERGDPTIRRCKHLKELFGGGTMICPECGDNLNIISLDHCECRCGFKGSVEKVYDMYNDLREEP